MYLNLILGTIRHDRPRTLSAIFGVAAAVGLLTWQLGLATTAISQAHIAVANATAPFSAWITGAPNSTPPRAAKHAPHPAPPTGRNRAQADSTTARSSARNLTSPLPPPLQPAVAASPLVRSLLPLATHAFSLDFRPGGRVLQGPPMTANFAALPATGLPFHLPIREGRLPNPSAPTPEAIVNANLFGRRVPKPALGTPMPVILPEGTLSITIVGFYEASRIIRAFPTAYLNPAALRAMAPLAPTRNFHQPNLLLIQTAPHTNPADLGFLLDTIPSAHACRLTTRAALETRFRSDTVSHLLHSLPLSLSLALITAAFMLVAVMNIGLTARRKQIAALRCIGLTRRGAAYLAALETLLLLLPGWLCGLLAGTALLQIFLLLEHSPELPKIVHLGWQTPLLTLLLALLVGLFAMLLPALRAMRIHPLEIFHRPPAPPRPFLLGQTILGLLLLIPLPVLSLLTAPHGKLALHLSMIGLGLPTCIAGLTLTAHPLMFLTERLFRRPLAAILHLDPRLLSRRLSRDPHRVLGIITSLSLGLGAFIAIHIWGATLMSSYLPSPSWPDAIASLLPSGIPRAHAAALPPIPGLRAPPIPIEAIQCPLDPSSNQKIARRGHAPPTGHLLLFGANPFQAYTGTPPFAPFPFVEGNPSSAAAAMTQTHACIVPTMFTRLTGLHLGDSFSVAGHPLSIAGVIELNWHLVTSRAMLRSRPPAPTFSMAFVSEDFARLCSGNTNRTSFLWLNYDNATRALHPLHASLKINDALAAALPPSATYALRVHARDEIADGTLAHGNDILGTMARIPFWSLFVTSTGLIALLLASARASKPELSTMRAIGMTHAQLRRLLFGEAALVSLCALLASLIGGTLIGWSFTAWTRLASPAGLPVTLAIPWLKLAQGLLFTTTLCLLMALIPLHRIPALVDAPHP